MGCWDSRVAHEWACMFGLHVWLACLACVCCEGSAQARTAYDLNGSRHDPGRTTAEYFVEVQTRDLHEPYSVQLMEQIAKSTVG